MKVIDHPDMKRRFPFLHWLLHKHDFKIYVSRELQGAHFGRAWKVEPCYKITMQCVCGEQKVKEGIILPLLPFKTDTDGWPLTDDGKRMEIAK